MNFQNILFTLAALLLLSITGTGYARKDSATCGDGNGTGSKTDTLNIEGTIESVRIQDSMFVVNTQEGKDTVYFDSKTKFALGDPSRVLRPDSKIQIEYVTEKERKVATRIEPSAVDGNGSGNDTTPEDTGTAPDSTPDEQKVPGE
jgi:hypothetical protein